MTRSAFRPAARRVRHWTAPQIGDQFVRSVDQSVWTVRNVYRRDQQVQLFSEVGERVYVTALELGDEFCIVGNTRPGS